MTESSPTPRVHRGFPNRTEVHNVNQSFSFYERVGLFALIVISIGSFLGFLWAVNRAFLIDIPASGGTLTEGIVGTPRFINPLLAISDADRDLTVLIYSGLLRVAPDGSLIPDLATGYTTSDDKRTYTFTLRDDLLWHDGTPITVDDVIFTIEKALDPAIKSPRRANWEGVTIEKLGTHSLSFTLKQPYASFLENMTMGILPKHKWGIFDAESFPFSPLNTNPVGSGPYRIKKIKSDANGIPASYELEPFRNATNEEAKIDITLLFFDTTESLVRALKNGTIESASALSPQQARELASQGYRVVEAPLPRIFAAFVNQSQAPIFTHQEVRKALSLATPRENIVAGILAGYGTSIDGPLPPGALGYASSTIADHDIKAARELLDSHGWLLGPDGVRSKKTKEGTEVLSFTLDTSNVPELKAVAETLKNSWAELGISVKPQYYEESDLKNLVIRPRKYESLLFGEVVGRNPDPFSFWHSSQRLDPGLNIALYTNASVDTLLTEARSLFENTDRIAKFSQFQSMVRTDTPAIFLYAPSYIYIVPDSLKGVVMPPITVGSDRFAAIALWYEKSDRVWKVFANYYR